MCFCGILEIPVRWKEKHQIEKISNLMEKNSNQIEKKHGGNNWGDTDIKERH